MVLAFLISNGMLFQIKAPEKDKLFLNMFNLGFCVLKYLFESDHSHCIFAITAFNLEHFSDLNWRNALSYLKYDLSFVHENYFFK